MSMTSMAHKQAPYTRLHAYLRGQYVMGHTKVPYYNITMSIPDAILDLRLQRDVVLDPKEPVNFSELFQRDVDLQRVHDEIVKEYLNPPHQIKFFNSLTVVLLPTDPKTKKILPAYQAEARPGSPQVEAGMTVKEVGPVQLQELGDTELGKISWDRDSVNAVIVDGQHRFSALKSAFDDQDFPWSAELRNSYVPVLLLVLDPRAGFEFDKISKEGGSVLDASRSIFIDLNKNARTVSKSRRFLLDDRDLKAVAMRSLIDQKVGQSDDFKDVFDRIDKRGTIPVALIEWHGDNPKFDTTRYLSTTLTMYEIADLTLGEVEISSSDLQSAKESLDSIIARFRIDDSLPEFGLIKELKRCDDAGEPFMLSRIQIAAVADAYARSRGRLVVEVLTQLTPYSELIKAYEQSEVVNGKYEQWAALDARGQRAFMESLGEDSAELNSRFKDDWMPVKARYPLAFQVVFQKSLVASVSYCYQMQEITGPLLGIDDGVDENAYARAWVQRFNSRLGEEIKKSFKGEYASNDTFWHGSVVSPSGSISYADSSRKALTAALVVAISAPVDKWTSEKDAIRWVKANCRPVKSGEKASAERHFFGSFGSTWCKSLANFERTRLRVLGKMVPEKSGLTDLAEKRVAHQLYALKRPGTPQED